MRPPLALALAALVMTGSAAAAVLTGPGAPDLLALGSRANDADAARDAPADAHDHAAHAHDAPARVAKAPEGVTPTLLDAVTTLERRGDVVIRSDLDWTPAAGVRSGAGTPDDPFVLSGYYVDTILVADTSKCYEIAGNYVSRILVLDWTGPCGLVHHNHLANFRTNRNVERTGDPTGAVITKNAILEVEELRHFDGVLTENVIGDEDAKDLPVALGGVVLNIAGLNGADISKNRIYGGVDMKLHGHHHSDAEGRHSHNHGKADGAQNETAPELHNVRYVNFLFRDNAIVDKGFGLRYNDLNHAGDDRTATSEQEPTLENAHSHYTTVKIANNVIDGKGLRVSVFNAPDERHLGERGTLVLEGNTLKEPASGNAVTIQDVRGATVVVSANKVEKAALKLDGGSGILLQRFENATVRVEGNTLPGFTYGVRASEFDASTLWYVVGNTAPGAKNEIYWDETVPNAPNSAPDAGGAPSGHDHGAHEHGGEGEDTAADAAPRAGGLDALVARFARR